MEEIDSDEAFNAAMARHQTEAQDDGQDARIANNQNHREKRPNEDEDFNAALASNNAEQTTGFENNYTTSNDSGKAQARIAKNQKLKQQRANETKDEANKRRATRNKADRERRRNQSIDEALNRRNKRNKLDRERRRKPSISAEQFTRRVEELRQFRSEYELTYDIKQVMERNEMLQELRGLPKIAMRNDKSDANSATRCNIDTFDESKVPRRYLGPFDCVCKYCGALGFACENKSNIKDVVHFGAMCCNQGVVELDDVPQPPKEVMDLFIGDTKEAKQFRQNVRVLNMRFALGSLQVDDRTDRSKGDASFKVCGILYRRMGSVQQSIGSTSKPKCIQAYFYDPDEQLTIRMSIQHKNDKEREVEARILKVLQESMYKKHSYLQSFLMASEYCEIHGYKPEDIRLELHESKKPPKNGDHRGRYHLPTCGEVAILLPEVASAGNRSVVVNLRNTPNTEELWFVPDYHKSWDPIMYPLFFIDGTDGWHMETNVTLRQHFRWRIMKRSKHENHLHGGSRLFQQYCVDKFAADESANLRWIKNNQATLRADVYNSLKDSISSDILKKSGRTTILPASHHGSDRWYDKRYKDAMALVRKFGKPTFFLTMTFNIKCKELMDLLLPGQSPYDRPDLICRIFRQQLAALMYDITKNKIFGECLAHSYSVEFQKRGAPHIHLLFWIKDFIVSPENIDQVISAEIPNPQTQPELYQAVVTKMLHGPCGCYNKKLACMQNGTCSKNFPFEFSQATVMEG